MILYMESFLFVFIGSFKYAYLLICIFPTTVFLMSLHAPTALKSGNPLRVKNLDDYINPACENKVNQFHNLSDVFILCSIILKYINYLLPSPVYSCFCSQYHLITQHIYRNRQTVFLQNLQDRSDLLHFQMSVHVHIQHPFYYEYSL